MECGGATICAAPPVLPPLGGWHCLRLSRLTGVHIEHPECRLIGIARFQYRVSDVEDGNALRRPSLGLSLVRMTVKHRFHVEARQGLLHAARSEVRIYLERLSLDGLADWRVMQHRNAMIGVQPSKRRFQLQRLFPRFVDELFDDRPPPRPYRSAPEPAAEPTYAGKPNSVG